MTEPNKDMTLSGEAKSFKEKVKAVLGNETFVFLLGLFCILFAVYLLIPFFSFLISGGADESLLTSPDSSEELMSTDNEIENMGGARGAQIANWLINKTFGVSSIFIIVFLAVVGLRLMKARRFNIRRWFFGCTMLLIWFSIFLGYFFYPLYESSHVYLGGLHGYNVSHWLASQIGVSGLLFLLLASSLSILVYFNKKWIESIRGFFSGSLFPNKIKKVKHKKSDTPESTGVNIEKETVQKEQSFEDVDTLEKSTSKDKEDILLENNGIDIIIENHEDQEKAEEERVSLNKEATLAPSEDEVSLEVDVPLDEKYEGEITQPYNPRLDLEYYKYPTLDLMAEFDDDEPRVDMEEQNLNKDNIITTLRSFGIEITSIKATVGPTVTLYEITPAQGVRISKIRNLEDDIALSLSALGIRIIAPIPGKGTIGIEVPNANPKIVSGRSIIGSKKFQECDYELPVAFGKTITNDVFIVDLCKMPHVLVAGATGQGKSVGLNTMITSLLYKKHPAELKFVLIDPKKVEFSIYSVIRNHYLAQLPDAEESIITDVDKVVHTLNSVCTEMDNRYNLLKAAKVRNIKEYNKKFVNRKLNPDKGHDFMPYIVVVIDEFGDLIMTAGKDIELPIARIAQLARAVGIHMVIATQRPTTSIITGNIKANFPARVAFRVSSMMDSRTILDRPGANQLIGKGDMLFLQGSEPKRVQCAFIDTPEVENITKFIAMQQGYPTPFLLPEYVDPKSNSGGFDEDEPLDDPLVEEAARMVVSTQQGSTSAIQRKFRIGYNRAGSIMDELERLGVVGPVEGSKPREVLCQTEADLENRLNI